MEMKRLKSPTGRARNAGNRNSQKARFLFNLASVRKMLVLPDGVQKDENRNSTFTNFIGIFLGG